MDDLTNAPTTALSAECPAVVLSAVRWRELGEGLWSHPVLEVGKTYKHPKEGWTLAVDEAFAARLVRSIETAVTAGVDMPLLRNHSFDEKLHVDNAVLGYIKGATIRDGWVCVSGRFQDDAAAQECRRVGRLSVGLLRSMTDGDSQDYTPALHHVAVSPFPVVNRQGQLAVAATRGGQEVPVLMSCDVADDQLLREMAQGPTQMTY